MSPFLFPSLYSVCFFFFVRLINLLCCVVLVFYVFFLLLFLLPCSFICFFLMFCFLFFFSSSFALFPVIFFSAVEMLPIPNPFVPEEHEPWCPLSGQSQKIIFISVVGVFISIFFLI